LINRRSGLPGGFGFGALFVIEGSEGQTENTVTNPLDAAGCGSLLTIRPDGP
jgi:hypothetical protein